MFICLLCLWKPIPTAFFIAFDFVDRVNLCPCSIAIIQQLKMSL